MTLLPLFVVTFWFPLPDSTKESNAGMLKLRLFSDPLTIGRDQISFHPLTAHLCRITSQFGFTTKIKSRHYFTVLVLPNFIHQSKLNLYVMYRFQTPKTFVANRVFCLSDETPQIPITLHRRWTSLIKGKDMRSLSVLRSIRQSRRQELSKPRSFNESCPKTDWINLPYILFS